MKQILTFLIVFNSVFLYGQDFLSDTKKWNDLYEFFATCNCSMHETHSYYLSGDSTIQGKEYKILYDSTYSTNSYSDRIEVTKKGFIRELKSNKEIFFIENGRSEETKIYDFDFDVDSSLTIGLYTYTVKSTDSVDISGIKRKIIYFSEDENNGLSWISGIGANQGLFYFQFQMGLLLCVKDSNVLIYKDSGDYDCVFFDYVSSINESETNGIKVYPNPAENNLMITSKEVIENVEIYNLSGIMVMSFLPKNTELNVNIRNLKKGIYFARVNNKTIKFIKE